MKEVMEDITNKEGERIIGRDAQRNNILAARVVAETIKSTLGPKGMDKMLVDHTGGITITNDGVTILEEMDIEHPAAKMIVDIAKTQEETVGDGTTTAVMIAGKLLENAEELLDNNIHPTIITKGYRKAEKKAQEILKEIAQEINTEEELLQVAQTAMTGKGAEYLKEHFSQIIIEATKTLATKGRVNKKDIKIIQQKGGKLQDTKLIKGILLKEEKTNNDMPTEIENAKIALLEEALEIPKTERETQLNITDPERYQEFIIQEEQELQRKAENIIQSGTNAIMTTKGIDKMISYYLAQKGIYALQRITTEELQALAKTTGARIITTLKELTENDLGQATIKEKKLGEETTTEITKTKNEEILTILIRGGTTQTIQETQRAFEDALGDVITTLPHSQVLAGGGATEIEIAKQLEEEAKNTKGREQLAIQAYAKALECIPRTLAENAGLDPLEIITEIKTAHEEGKKHVGINLFNKKVEDTYKEGILEPLNIKTQALHSATEVANMILRIDDVIAARKRKGNNANKGIKTLQGYD